MVGSGRRKKKIRGPHIGHRERATSWPLRGPATGRRKHHTKSKYAEKRGCTGGRGTGLDHLKKVVAKPSSLEGVPNRRARQ